jgi:hypothetical protein
MRIGPGLHLTQPRRVGSFISNHVDTKAYLKASTYNPENHFFPNGKLSGVMGGLPGSSHSLAFGRDENGAFAYLDQTANAHLIQTPTLHGDLTSTSIYSIEQKLSVPDVTPAVDVRLFRNPSDPTVRLLTTGAIWFRANGAAVTSSAIVSANGVTASTPWAWQVRVSGTAVNFYTSLDDGATWDILGVEQTGASTETWASGDNYIGAQSTVEPMLGPVYWTRVRDDATGTGSLIADFNASMFIPGNQGHGAEATDAQGNTWTITRAGSPLSVIDDGDGNGKRVRYRDTTNAGLISSITTPPTSDFSVRARIIAVDWTPSTEHDVVSMWNGSTNDRAFRFVLGSGGIRAATSLDGIAQQFTGAVATGGTDGEALEIRFDFDADNGASGRDATYFTRAAGTAGLEDDTGWSQIGTATFAGAAGSVHPASTGVELGSLNRNSSSNDNMDMLKMVMLDSDGTTVLSSFDAANINRHQFRIDRTVDSDVVGETWLATFTDDAEDANDPPVLWHYGDDYVWLESGASNRCTMNIGDGIANGSIVDLRVDVQCADWTPGTAQRFTDPDLNFILESTGAIKYIFDGASTFPSATSSAVLPVVDGQRAQLRLVHDNTNDTVNFYYRFGTTDLSDDTGWTELGAQQSITSEGFDAALTGGTTNLDIGAASSGIDNAKIYRALVKDDGTVVWNIDPSDAASADGTSWTDATTGNTVTINRATSGFATVIVKAPVIVGGGSHEITVPHHPDLNADPVTAAISLRQFVGTAWRFFLGKKANGTAATLGWGIQAHDTNPRIYSNMGDGSSASNVGSGSNNITFGDKATVIAALDSNDHEHYVDGASEASATPGLSDVDPTDDLLIFRNTAASSHSDTVEMFAVAIFSSRATDAEALAIHNELAAL